MDVRLPDGTIIRGVPDGMTKEQLTAKLKANGYNLDEPKAQEQTSAAGGVLETAGRVAQLATPGGLVASLATKEGRDYIANAVAGAVRGDGSIGATLLDAARSTGDAVTAATPENMRPSVTAGNATTPRGDEIRSGMDAGLKALGADPQSVPFQAAKVGTEVAATLPLGGAAGRLVAQVAPRLGTAIASGGLSTGARVASGVAPQAADLGIRTAGAVVNAGLSAGAVNPEDVPQAMSVAGATPAVTRVLGAAGRTAGNALSGRLAQSNALSKIADLLGEAGTSQAVADIQTHYPKGAENIPLSAAAVTANPKLAQLEQGSRLRSAPQWWEFDQRQGKAVFDNVMDATKEAGDLGARKAARAENWQQAWAKASESQKPRIWQARMTQFGADLEQALQSPEASNPAVRQVLEAINAEFDRVGPNFSPAHLQQLRANLSGKANTLSTDVFKSAPRDNPAIISVMKEMDDILNVSTGGKWQKVLEGYAKDSDSVRAAAAASKVRGAFVDEQTGRVVGKSLDPHGDVPVITETGLNRAVNAARLPDKSLALSPDANARVEATLDALRRQGVVQGLKKAASAGGGSDTVPNEIASELAQRTGAPNILLQVLGAARKLGTAKTDNALARLLSNPDELAAALAALQRPQAPNALAALAYRGVPAIAADR